MADCRGSSIGYALICGPDGYTSEATSDFIAGIYFTRSSYDSEEESDEETDEPYRLVWLHRTPDNPRSLRNRSTVLATDITDGWYTVDATFAYTPGSTAGTAQVSVNGGGPVSLPFLSRPLNSIQLYNYSLNGKATYGDIDVWHKEAPGSAVYAPRKSGP